MFVLFLFLFIQLTTALPFPKHVDLQKMGEITFNNEKYNVLKPTVHIITDHFEDTMLRRDTHVIPSKRVFMDKNGFRHYWSGFEEGQVKRKSGPLDVKKNGNDASNKKDGNDKTAATKYRPKRIQDIPLEPITPSSIILRQNSDSAQSGRTMTIAKTTFFCPFIGVLTMTSRLDDE